MDGALKTAVKRAWWDAKNVVSKYPPVAMPIARIRKHGVVVAGDTEIVIEGYPRSANSFAVAAFDMPQPRPLKIAHHTHAPAQIVTACRKAIPTLVLVREPDATALNTCIYHPELTVKQALHSYITFHTVIWPYRDRFVVGPFPEVTSDFGATMRRVNERFGTAFVPFDHTPENVQRVFTAIDTFWKAQVGEGETFERVVGRPSEWRDQRREEMRVMLEAPEVAPLRARAQAQYRTLVASTQEPA